MSIEERLMSGTCENAGERFSASTRLSVERSCFWGCFLGRVSGVERCCVGVGILEALEMR